MKRSIAVAGIFLVVVGFIFLILGTWYAWMYGIATDIRIWSLLFPGAGGDLLSFISLSSSLIVLGIFLSFGHTNFQTNLGTEKIGKIEA